MSRALNVMRMERIIILSFMILAVTSVAGAQARAKKGSRLATPSTSNAGVEPQLLNADTNPTLRFPIARGSITVSSISYGWFDISRGRIQYTPEAPSKKLEDGFSAATADIRDLKFDARSNSIGFRAGDKREIIIYVPQEEWVVMHGAHDFFGRAAEGESGTQSIYRTMLDFDAELALVKSTAAPAAPVVAAPVATPTPPPTPAAPAAPPSIVVAAPSGVAANQTIEVSESTVVIRGVAMDTTGMPVVRIGGAAANMRPQNPQAEEFWSDPLQLKPGDNPVQIEATNSANARTTFAFTLHYTPKAAPVNPKALDKAEIVSLLQGSVPSDHVSELVQERGLKFNPTAEDLNEIRSAGGSDELIRAIQGATSHP